MSNEIEVCKVSNYLPISQLAFHPNNPRTIQPDRLEALKKSIRTKGFYQPILVWKKDNIVLCGNHRLLASQELLNEGWVFKTSDGHTDVLPVVVEDVSDAMARAILLETNNTYAEWVDEKLSEALTEATAKGYDIDSFGFKDMVADALLDADKALDQILPDKSFGGTDREWDRSREISSDDFATFEHTCLNCNFSFDGAK